MAKGFLSNAIALISGTSVAQLIPLLASLVLTRLFTPEDFGILALFVSLSNILNSFSTGRYELAIMIPESVRSSYNIFLLTLILVSGFSAFYLLTVILINLLGIQFVSFEQLGFWLLLVPFYVFLFNIHGSLRYLCLKLDDFWVVSKATMIRALVLALVSIGIGLVLSGPTGLLLGQFLAVLFGNGLLVRSVRKNIDLKNDYSRSEILSVAKRFVNFPKFSLPAGVFNTLSYDMLKMLIGSVFTTYILGLYSFIDKILGAPSVVIGNALGQTFFKSASDLRINSKSIIGLFDKLSVSLFLVGVILYSIIYFIAGNWFGFIFGEEWIVAGRYAQILTPFLFIRFIVSPLTNINNVMETQKFGLFWQFGKFLVAISSILYAQHIGWNFESWLTTFSYCMSIYFVVVYVFLREIAKGRFQNLFGSKMYSIT